MGAYSRWALIRGWALIQINTVIINDKNCRPVCYWVSKMSLTSRHKQYVFWTILYNWVNNVLDKTAGKMKIWLNKNALTAAASLLAWRRLDREMRRRLVLHETGFTRWRFFTSYFIEVEYSSGYLLFICVWIDLVPVLATTAVHVYKYMKIHGPRSSSQGHLHTMKVYNTRPSQFC